MGRVKSVLSTQDIVNHNVDTYIKDSTRNYPNFLETAPTFITYYSRAAYKSTYDESFEAYNEIAGEESPNKFHKIENLPIYSLDTSDFGKEMGEDGWTGEVSSSCIILPNTITPRPDDLIEVEIHTKKYLFQVTNSSSDNYGNLKFYKINFRLSQYRKDEVTRATSAEYEVDFEKIGKNDNVLVRKDYKELIDLTKIKYDELLSFYVELYYDKKNQSFIDKNNGYLDQYLNYFMHKNELNKPFITYRNSSIITPILRKYVDGKDYRYRTFYYDLENDNVPNMYENTYYITHEMLSKSKYGFNFYNVERFNFVVYSHSERIDRFNAYKLNFEYIKDFYDEKDNNHVIISKYLKLIETSGTTNLSKEKLEEILTLISDIDIEVDYNEDSNIHIYYKFPLLLFIMKKVLSLIAKL